VPPASFEWDDANTEHIALHGVEPDEAEAAVANSALLLRTQDNRLLAYGQTDEGRYLLVVFVRKPGHLVRVVTARDLTDPEKQRLRRRRR
jgi:uncharacterized DUF497 family protein